MQGTQFTQSFHIPGTLSANLAIEWLVPYDCQLIHVSVSNTANSGGTFIIGTSADDNAYLDTSDVGNNDSFEFDKADFVGAEYPHIVDGTKVLITVDFDGAGGTAAANLTLVLTFTEG